MDQIKPRCHFQCMGNIWGNWRLILQAFEVYLMAIDADSKCDKPHCHMLDCGRTGHNDDDD